MQTIEEFKMLPVSAQVQVPTPISTEYRSQWGVWEAIREIVQNSLDETEQMPILTRTTEGNIVIHDDGDGCELPNMIILGKSQKKDGFKRGQYGEGVKIASVILLKAGCKVQAQSRDWIIEFRLGKLLSENILEYNITKTDGQHKGFSMIITGLDFDTVYEIMTTKFVDPSSPDVLHTDSTYGRLLTGKYKGNMYKRNIFVAKCHKEAEFGYDLFNVDTGTDRNFMNTWDADENMGKLLSTVKDRAIIKKVIELQQKDVLESEASGWKLTPEYLAVFEEIFGSVQVIDTDNELKGKVHYNGGNQVTVKNYSFASAMQREGFYSAEKFLEMKAQQNMERSKKQFSELGQDKQRIVMRGLNLIKMIEGYDGEKMFPINARSMINDEKLKFFEKKDSTLGYVEDNIIYIATSQLNNMETFCKTMIEELIHTIYDTNDITAEHERALKEAINGLIKLLTNYISPRTLDVEG